MSGSAMAVTWLLTSDITAGIRMPQRPKKGLISTEVLALFSTSREVWRALLLRISLLIRKAVRFGSAGACDSNWNALGRRREAQGVVRVQRHQRIGLGIVRRAAAVREGIADDTEIAHPAVDAVVRDSDEVHAIAIDKTALVHLRLVEEYDVALAIDTAIEIRHRVNGGVVLIVAAGRAEPERVRLFLFEVLAKPLEYQEICLA